MRRSLSSAGRPGPEVHQAWAKGQRGLLRLWLRRGTALALLGAACLAGCAPAINWRGYSFPSVHELSQRENRLTFVYFRSWYQVACTEFEENVLRDARVRSATTDLNCVALDFEYDQRLAQRWGLNERPAFAIITPAGDVLTSAVGAVSVDEVVGAIEEAKAVFAAAQPPAVTP